MASGARYALDTTTGFCTRERGHMIGVVPTRNYWRSAVTGLWGSTIGKKAVMAVTGMIWFGYLILHLWGNLKVYEGAAQLNTYAGFLRTAGTPLFGSQQLLWLVRVVLIVALGLHIVAAYQLTRLDLASRPVPYALRRYQKASLASRTMRWGGVAIALFLVYHILHFTTGAVHPDFVEGDVYHNLIAGFRQWPASLVYVLAMVAVGMHLYHGVWSMLQTLGIVSLRSDGLWRNFARVAAALITLGNISIPVAVLAGVVR